MDKWADWLISAVSYDEDENRIEKVEVHEDQVNRVGPGSEAKRGWVISQIASNKTFVTICKVVVEKSSGKFEWHKGADVHVVEVEGDKYIRTDRNNIKEDNLGELPTF